MPIARIDILCECENPHCAKRFGVELDTGTFLIVKPQRDFLGDVVEGMVHEAIRAGNGTYYTWAVRGKATVDRTSLSGSPSIQGGLMLCDECTKKCDAVPVEGNLTKDQVERALRMGLEDDDEEDIEEDFEDLEDFAD
jgi:hypothetical protein